MPMNATMPTRFKILAIAALAVALAGCKYETVPDPQLSKRDVELLALAPKKKQDKDAAPSRWRVSYASSYAPGTIVIENATRYLYFIEEGGTALRYKISTGQDSYIWRGEATVGRKVEWPRWVPGDEARKLNPSLPEIVQGGPKNPLGARGLYLFDDEGNDTQYRIHGTNEPESIGRSVSLGCIRMHNIDAIDLYNRVKIGSRVVVR
jgi:lipoprotein-anchoring transpeptidase ErfK/SrfK